MDIGFTRAGCETFPLFHYAVSHYESVSYRASSAAVRRFGHTAIIEALGRVMSDETGALRDYNVDALPVSGYAEPLCVVRSRGTGEIIVLGEQEYRRRFEWPLPGTLWAKT